MKRKLIGSVTMPAVPRAGRDQLEYNWQVYRCLEQLKNRILPVQQSVLPPARASLPLLIIPSSTNDTWKIKPGTVNGVTPTLGGTAIDATEPPEITVTADTYVWLKCVGTFGSPDSYVVTVETSATSDTPAGTDISDTGFVAFYYVGSILENAVTGAYEETNEHSGGNLGVDSWGLYNLWFKV